MKTYSDYVSEYKLYCSELFNNHPMFTPGKDLKGMMKNISEVPDNTKYVFDKANEKITSILIEAEKNATINFQDLNQTLIDVFQNEIKKHLV